MIRVDFNGLHKARDRLSQQADRKRRKARLLEVLSPRLMKKIRLFRLEIELLWRYFTPINQRVDLQVAQPFADYQPGPAELLASSLKTKALFNDY